MIRFVPYEPWHLHAIELQPIQELWRDKLLMQPGYAESLVVPGLSWSAVLGKSIVAMAGLSPQWEGRVIAWGLFGETVPKFAWSRIVRRMKLEMYQITKHGPHRVEMTVPGGFYEGTRLARMLGFEVEGKLKFFGPDGRDHFQYAKVVGLPCVQ